MPSIKLPSAFTIQTERCRLRKPTAEDIPHVFSATRHVGFNDGMLWDAPAAPSELEEPLRRATQVWEAGEAFSFTIERLTDQSFLGRIGIRPAKTENCWNIGFWLHPNHQGNGYMRESALAVLEFGFQKLGARVIDACCATWNTKSERVLQNIGMEYQEHIPQGYMKRDKWVPEHRYAITDAQWRNRHGRA
jgi:ribosomal-protein-alanine N-acetyltransferase